MTDHDASCGGDAVGEDSARYLDELVKDMRELNALPGAYPHALRLLNEEIDRIWSLLYSGGQSFFVGTAPVSSASPRSLLTRPPFPSLVPTIAADNPSVVDQGITVQEKIPIPFYPRSRCNFIGRILGPRGISVKQIESETECHILVRGRGSVKDPQREARLMHQPGWEHLSEPLHVLVKAVDPNQIRAEAKLRRGVAAISRLLTPNNDEHKRRQLVQLAIINGTYRSEG